MTNIIRKCRKCGEIIYRFEKGNRPSNLVLGAEIGIHMMVCDPKRFDKILQENF